jgi:hypothetical protein
VNVTTAGDLGDIVVLLATLRDLPPPHTLLLRDDGRTKGIVRRKHIIAPLVESQGIKCVPWRKGDKVDWASEKFRDGHHRTTEPLAMSPVYHALAEGVITKRPDVSKPWLTVEPSKESKGRVIVARSARYNNPHFPWAAILKHLGKRALFVGAPDEHVMLQNAFGCKVGYRPTKGLLEVAQLVAGSDLFIGNQSAPMTVAEGLKHPRIQETCLWVPDCIYPPDGTNQYSGDGFVEFEDFKNTFSGFDVKTIDYREIPRKGWVTKYGGITENRSTPQNTAKHLSKRTGLDYDLALKEVLQQALAREPRFFAKLVDTTQFRRVAQALSTVGWKDTHLQRLVSGDASFYVS